MKGELREVYLQLGLDLSQINAAGDWMLPLPATYVVDTAGIITYGFVDVDYRKRADPEEILAAVRPLVR